MGGFANHARSGETDHAFGLRDVDVANRGSGGKESGGGLLSSLSEDLLLLLEPNLKKDGAWFCFLLGFLESWVEIEVESGSVVLLGALWITLASTGTGGGLL